jgi:tetratricopeptide (TPR) repeat protein
MSCLKHSFACDMIQPKSKLHMSTVRKFLFVNLMFFLVISAWGAGYVIAVFPFENIQKNPEYDWIGTGIMETVITDLMKIKEWIVLDRANLEKNLKEIQFSLSDLADEQKQLKVGGMLSANVIVTGSYQIMDKTILINVRFTETETGKVIKAGKLQGDVQTDLFELQSKIVYNLVNDINEYNAAKSIVTADLTRDLKNKIDEKPTNNVKALEYYTQARDAYFKADFARAEESALKAVNQDGKYFEPVLLLAQIGIERARYDKALEYSDRAFKLIRKGGDADFKSMSAFLVKGLAYQKLGKYGEAVDNYSRALALSSGAFGEAHPHTAEAYYHIGWVYVLQNKYEDALAFYNKALLIYEKTFGDTHLETAYMYHHIGWAYQHLAAPEQQEKALMYFEKARKVYEKSYADRHTRLGVLYFNMGNIYAVKGRYDEALGYYKKALAIQERLIGTEHVDTSYTYAGFAWVYLQVGKLDEALGFAEKALKIQEKTLGSEHDHTNETYELVGRIHYAKGEYPRALSYFQKMLKALENTAKTESASAANCLYMIGWCNYAMVKPEEALSYFKRALPLFEKISGKSSRPVADTLASMGGTKYGAGKYKEAEKYLLEALDIYNKTADDAYSMKKWCYSMLSYTYKALGDDKKAKLYEEKAK